MELRVVLALGLGLVTGTVLSTSAQLPLQHGQAAPLCKTQTGAGTPEEHALRMCRKFSSQELSAMLLN
jgi:hypothetical protein